MQNLDYIFCANVPSSITVLTKCKCLLQTSKHMPFISLTFWSLFKLCTYCYFIIVYFLICNVLHLHVFYKFEVNYHLYFYILRFSFQLFIRRGKTYHIINYKGKTVSTYQCNSWSIIHFKFWHNNTNIFSSPVGFQIVISPLIRYLSDILPFVSYFCFRRILDNNTLI